MKLGRSLMCLGNINLKNCKEENQFAGTFKPMLLGRSNNIPLNISRLWYSNFTWWLYARLCFIFKRIQLIQKSNSKFVLKGCILGLKANFVLNVHNAGGCPRQRSFWFTRYSWLLQHTYRGLYFPCICKSYPGNNENFKFMKQKSRWWVFIGYASIHSFRTPPWRHSQPWLGGLSGEGVRMGRNAGSCHWWCT